MIKEAYVSYEIAKLLKEKGFDGEIHTTYDDEGYTQPSITHQMACAWLREKHNMHVDIDPSEGDWYPCVIELETWSSLSSGKMPICNSYEEAVEVGLKYALENLI